MGKLYEGSRRGGSGIGDGNATVTVDGRKLDPRYDIANHSPDGFEWGYGGSGPTQLAIAIVTDVLGTPKPLPPRNKICQPCQSEWDISDRTGREPHIPATGCACRDTIERNLARVYMRFRDKVIARIDKDSWSLTEEQVRAVLAEIDAEA